MATSHRDQALQQLDTIILLLKDQPELIKELLVLRTQITEIPSDRNGKLAQALCMLRIASVVEFLLDHWTGGHGPHT